jgi:type II secretory pathway component PulJ
MAKEVKTKQQRTNLQRSFTLVEVLLALLMTSVLLLGIHGLLKQAHAIWARAENDRPIYQQARIMTELLRKEFSGLYMPPHPTDTDGNEGKVFALSSDTAEFFTFTPSYSGGTTVSRAASVRYHFEDNVLRRTERPYASEKAIVAASESIVTHDLSQFTFSAFDPEKKQWQDAYESKTTPPKAIKLSWAWMSDNSTKAVGFDTVFSVPCQTVIMDTE